MSAPIGTRATYGTIAEMHDHLVPDYKSRVYKPLLLTIQHWDYNIGNRVALINPDRAAKRIANYVDPLEMERAKTKLTTKDSVSLRFGVSKGGTGNFGERGDFCLVGGLAEKNDLYLFWRSLELIGGFGYDMCMINHIVSSLNIRPRRVHMHAMTANVFALRGNSNQKLFPKLKEAIHDTVHG